MAAPRDTRPPYGAGSGAGTGSTLVGGPVGSSVTESMGVHSVPVGFTSYQLGVPLAFGEP